MKSSEILRKAARRVERGQEGYGCLAIEEVIFNHYEYFDFSERVRAPMAWLEMLRPRKLAGCGGYWGYKERGPRIIGLCLAAAIAESEGD